MTQRLGNVLIQVIQDLSKISTNGRATVALEPSVCSPSRFRRVFEYFTKGTILERIDLEVHEMTRKMECVCGAERAVQGPENGYMKCPECGRFAKVEESDYKIEQPDLSEVNPRSKFRC